MCKILATLFPSQCVNWARQIHHMVLICSSKHMGQMLHRFCEDNNKQSTSDSSDRCILHIVVGMKNWVYSISSAIYTTLQHTIWSCCKSPHEVNSYHFKDRAHLSTFEFFILEKFSCIVVLIVFFVIVQSSGLISVWFRQNMTFFINFISFHIFAIYVGGACWGLPAACRLIAVSGARLPSVDGLTVRYIKNAPLLNLPSKYVCDLFQTCFQYMYVRYKHTGTMLLCLQVALSFI